MIASDWISKWTTRKPCSGRQQKSMYSERLRRSCAKRTKSIISIAKSARKLRYEHIRESLLLDYKTKGNKGLEKNEDGEPYIWGLNHIDGYFRNRFVRTIKTNALHKFIEKKQDEGLANATINRCLALLKRAMNIARRDGKLASLPFFPMLKEDNVRQGFVNRLDFIKLRDAMP